MNFYWMQGSGSWMFGSGSGAAQKHWEAMFSGAVRPKEPFEFDVAYPGGGEKLPDVLGTVAPLQAVSPRMLQVLESIQATGYRAHPLILRHSLLGVTIHGYQGLLVHGSGGPVDKKRSGPTAKVILRCEGVYIHDDQWDGSDIFRIDGLGFNIFVTERAADALRKVRPKLRNVALTSNTERFP